MDYKQKIIDELSSILKHESVYSEIKNIFKPIVDLVLLDIYPYIYISLIFVIINFFLILANFIILMKFINYKN